MKILSFIIPAYNSEAFLDKCISFMLVPEVLEQLDIIIVNDGSSDKTAAIAEKYCAEYPGSIRLISQENKGHGGALNAGCAAACGKYLKVIDADDWIETLNLERFVRLLADCDSDVVLTHYHTIDIRTGEVKKWRSYPGEFGKPYSLEQIMTDWNNFERCMTLHGITYNTAFYHRCSHRLPEHVFYEDHEYATFPCCYARTATPFDLFIYDYRIGDVTQSVSEANQLKRISHTETVLNRMIQEASALSCGDGGKRYAAMKTQCLLLSYLTTALLTAPDRREGRALAAKQMELCKAQLPEAYALALPKYRAFVLMNRLHIRKKGWDRILHSAAYSALRKKHNFD